MPRPLRIAYLMEDTDLSGGVRVQLAQADALIDRGHEVTIVTRGLPLSWRASRAEWIYVDEFPAAPLDGYDFVIGTFWPTVRPAWEIAPDRTIHLCQGYEGSFSYYQDRRSEIEQTYRLPIPKMVVTRPLEAICRRFYHDVVYIGQIVEEEFFRARTPAENDPLRVLLAGPWQIDIKGVEEGYGAVAHAKWNGASLDLIRVSPWVPSPEEPSGDYAAEFHVALPADAMTRLVHSCDLFLGPNHKEEGFGLIAAEAMAAGIPTVLTRIPSYLSFDEKPDFAMFAEEGDAVQLGEGLVELIDRAELREHLRRRGREVAQQFRADRAAARIEEFLLSRR